jgi:EmrB/QacA subfamily drug resistance transporter
VSQLQHSYAAVAPVEAADLDLPDLAEAADAGSAGRAKPADASRKGGPVKAARTASPGQVLAIVCVGMVLANLDLFIVNVGLPSVARDLGNTNLENLSWILNGYTIVYAALLVFFGRFAERHRRDLSFLAGIAVFTLSSAACAAAPNVAALVAFRVAQAAGAALMTPTSLGLLLASYPPEQRGGAVRTWTAIGGFSAALGPLIGGLLITASWRWIFLVNVPIGVAALLIGSWKLPQVPGHDAPRPDPWAALFVTAGIGALTFAIVKVNDWGWHSAGILVSAAVAVLFLGLFVLDCVRSRNPFVDPSLFRIRPFTGAALVMAPFSLAFGALLLSTALWEQNGWNWSALQAGIAIAPGPLLVPIVSLLFAGRLIARFGAGAVVTAGVLVFATSFVWYATAFGFEPNFAYAVIGMVPAGIGVGLTFPTLMGVSTSSLSPSSFATGSGVIQMIRQAAIAIGVALFVALLGSPVSAAARLAAFQSAWWIMAAITLLGLIPTFVLIRRKR